jgi:hypothetical protein
MVNPAGRTAVPDNGTERVESEAFETMESIPFKVPEDWGAKVMLRFALWPGASVMGILIGVITNPAPDTATWLTTTLDPPEFVMATDCAWLAPTSRVPKVTGSELAVSEPGATTVDTRETVRTAFAALLVIATSPLAVAADGAAEGGVKVTLKLAL